MSETRPSSEPSPATLAELVAALTAFVEAEPWERLQIDDWFSIDGDDVPEDLAWGLVGDDRRMPYLTLVRSVADFVEADEELRAAMEEEREPTPLHSGWSLSSAARDEDDEVDDGPSLVPLSTVPEATPPITEDDVRHFARVLRALAAVDDAELAAGRFARRIEESDGVRELDFALPAVLSVDDLDDDELRDDDPESPAPYERFVEVPVRARRKLAERLVSSGLAPIDGHLLLADLASDADEARACCGRARDAAEAALAGPDAPAHAEENLLRALGGLATMGREAGEPEAVRTAWERSAAIDEEDPFATGLELLLALLGADRDADADALFDDERLVLDENESNWLQALVAHRTGNADAARRLRHEAAEGCPSLPLLADALLDEDENLLDERLDELDPDDPGVELYLRIETLLADAPDLAEWVAEAADGPRHTPKKRKRQSR